MCSNTKTKLHGIQGHRIIGNGLENHFQYYQQPHQTRAAVRSAADTIDRTTLRIQGGYGIGPNIQWLLGTFWGWHMVVP
jgi:hypothetical protein